MREFLKIFLKMDLTRPGQAVLFIAFQDEK